MVETKPPCFDCLRINTSTLKCGILNEVSQMVNKLNGQQLSEHYVNVWCETCFQQTKL